MIIGDVLLGITAVVCAAVGIYFSRKALKI